MPGRKKKPKKGGRPKLGKLTMSFRLSQEVVTQLRAAAASTGNLSVFVEEALKDRLRKEDQ
jgi:hypothetical protein